jgi:Flp pilus assembly protein TadG
VGTTNLRQHSLTAADFKPGVIALKGTAGTNGGTGATGPTGPAGPAGKNGSASVVMTARGTGTVTAPHGASTNVPLTGASWTQAANDLNLITGSMDVGVPSSCTGSYGNALVVSVDGVPNTFGVAPTSPASQTVPVPFQVSELMEPGASKQHTITASVSNSCTKSGEDFTISNVKMDVVNFH